MPANPPVQTDSSDLRLQILGSWARSILGREDLQITVASADASFRRYFRVAADTRTWIAMDAPPDKEDIRPFIKVSSMLVDAGVNAPEVLAKNLEAGFLLLSDLGDCTYLGALERSSEVDGLYADALKSLVQMQSGCVAGASDLPPYDAALLDREMRLFPEWFIAKHLALDVSAEQRDLTEAFAALAAAALEQPRVFVHRDYHSRNLMVCAGRNPGVLDFQDAVFGPVTYDLVSVLRDCYIAWPVERVHRWVRDYLSLASDAAVPAAEFPRFLRWFDLMGIQRHLKAVGIFARLWHRDGKPGYLKDIPRTLGYIRAVAPNYPELRGLSRLIEDRLVPALARHPGPVNGTELI